VPDPMPDPMAGATWSPIPSFRPTAGGDSAQPYGQLGPATQQGPHPAAAVVSVPPGSLRPKIRNRRLPETVVDYPQLLRGPTRAWWRPLLTAVVFVALFAMLSILPFVVAMTYGLVTGIENFDLWLDDQLAEGALMDPGGYLYLNLGLIVLIPAAMLSIWAVHRIRPRFLSSVAGGLRWRWLLRCVVVLAPVWAVYLTVSTLTDPPQSPRSDQWVALLVIGLLLTPWQAAAEEYLFRGWITQNIGVYFARPLLAFVVPTVIAAAAFAAAHGSPDPWILADLALFSVVASVMTWRTGGLEAAIVLHAVNNVGIDIIVNTLGGFEESMVGAETRGTPLSFAVSALVSLLALALVLWQARRTGVDNWFRPQVPIEPPVGEFIPGRSVG
jgi:membrane protease YdiL (CAAX protease family)